jgi:osmotically-inducible protein OsmY
MTLLSRRARFALGAARTGLKTYGATQRARGRAAARKTKGGVGRGMALGTGVGAGLAYLFDPQEGRRRRHAARDRGMAMLRRGGREAARRTDYAAGVARGAVHAATPSGPSGPPPDDVTLARKVESIIFREADAPKGSVDVNAEHGVVYLRGEVESAERIRELVERASAVDGVAAVENLLHLPGAPAPMKA